MVVVINKAYDQADWDQFFEKVLVKIESSMKIVFIDNSTYSG